MTSDRNDSVKILNHCDWFLPDFSASIVKSSYANLVRSILRKEMISLRKQNIRNSNYSVRLVILIMSLKFPAIIHYH